MAKNDRKKKQQNFNKIKLQIKNKKLHANIRMFDDPILSEKCQDVTFEQGIKISRQMIQSLNATAGGVGLAAPQIGYAKNIIVIRPNHQINKCIVMINPLIKNSSSQNNVALQSCLSYPGFSKLVSRSNSVIIQYINQSNQTVINSYQQWQSRIIQHQIDHLNGFCHIKQAYQKDRSDKAFASQSDLKIVKTNFVRR